MFSHVKYNSTLLNIQVINMDKKTQIEAEVVKLKEALQVAIAEDKPSYITELYHEMLNIKKDELKLLQHVDDL